MEKGVPLTDAPGQSESFGEFTVENDGKFPGGNTSKDKVDLMSEKVKL